MNLLLNVYNSPYFNRAVNRAFSSTGYKRIFSCNYREYRKKNKELNEVYKRKIKKF